MTWCFLYIGIVSSYIKIFWQVLNLANVVTNISLKLDFLIWIRLHKYAKIFKYMYMIVVCVSNVDRSIKLCFPVWYVCLPSPWLSAAIQCTSSSVIIWCGADTQKYKISVHKRILSESHVHSNGYTIFSLQNIILK